MATLNKNIDEYKKQIEKGDIKKAYQGLMKYLMGLRTYLKKTYMNHSVFGLYQGLHGYELFHLYI